MTARDGIEGGAHFEEHILVLLERLGLDLLGELDYGLELRVVLLLLSNHRSCQFVSLCSGVARDISFSHRLRRKGRLTALAGKSTHTRRKSIGDFGHGVVWDCREGTKEKAGRDGSGI